MPKVTTTSTAVTGVRTALRKDATTEPSSVSTRASSTVVWMGGRVDRGGKVPCAGLTDVPDCPCVLDAAFDGAGASANKRLEVMSPVTVLSPPNVTLTNWVGVPRPGTHASGPKVRLRGVQVSLGGTAASMVSSMSTVTATGSVGHRRRLIETVVTEPSTRTTWAGVTSNGAATQ